MKRKEQKESSRARVLEAARACFADRDLRDVAMQEIAERARLSVGALYVHFESREALIDAVVGGLQDRLVAHFGQALLSVNDASLPVAVEALASSFVEVFGDLRPYVALYASHAARTTSAHALRGGGSAAPLVQMLNATLALVAVHGTRVDPGLLAGSIAAVWRAAALARTSRPDADGPAIARSLAVLTISLLATAAPDILTIDAREVARAMGQLLKQDQSLRTDTTCHPFG